MEALEERNETRDEGTGSKVGKPVKRRAWRIDGQIEVRKRGTRSVDQSLKRSENRDEITSKLGHVRYQLLSLYICSIEVDSRWLQLRARGIRHLVFRCLLLAKCTNRYIHTRFIAVLLDWVNNCLLPWSLKLSCCERNSPRGLQRLKVLRARKSLCGWFLHQAKRSPARERKYLRCVANVAMKTKSRCFD